MIRVVLCSSFLTLCLYWPQIFAEETTPSQETSNDSTNATTNRPESKEETKDVTKQYHDIILRTSSTDKTVTQDEDQDHIQRTASSENKSQSSTRDPANRSLEQDQDVEVIIENLVNKRESTSRDDAENNTSSSRRPDDIKAPQELKKKESSYLDKLTGNLLIPVLRTQNDFGKAWNHANEGIKNIGTGTFEAASGAFNFFRDAASAVVRSG